jgi:DNA-3-methyladenine glycosylase II
LRSADPRLAPLIDAHGERCAERLGGKTATSSTPPSTTFPRLVQTILAQQLSWKAASTIHRRLLVSAGLLSLTDEKQSQSSSSYENAALRLTPQRLLSLDEPQIRGAGVSGAKARALKDLAERYADGRLSDEMLRDAVTAAPEGLNAALNAVSSAPSSSSQCPGARAASALLAVKGVGPWSLDMVSMFVLGAPDVLPSGDLGVRKGLARLQQGGGVGGGKKQKNSNKAASLPDAAAAARIAAAWRPYRTVGSWLMWRLAEE